MRSPCSAIADGGGLYFRVHTSGVSQFYFRYRYGGKQRWLFLGNYPDLELKEARERAREARRDLDKGLDVAAEKQRRIAEEQASKLFRDVARVWYEQDIEKRYAHPLPVWRCVENHLLPKLGGTAVKNITPSMASAVLRKLVNEGKPTSANDALRYMKRIFAKARKLHLITINPVMDFEPSDAGGHEPGRERTLSDKELIKLFKAMDASASFGRDNELATKLLLILCVRKNELLKACWDGFDLEARTWSLTRTKNRKTILIPLPEYAVEMLNELKIRAGKSDYVFPARRLQGGKKVAPMNDGTLNLALKKVSTGIEPFTVHDLRRTAKTHLMSLGVSVHVAERCLNHAIGGVSGRYDRYDYFAERKTALEALSQLMLTYERGGADKVVPIRKA